MTNPVPTPPTSTPTPTAAPDASETLKVNNMTLEERAAHWESEATKWRGLSKKHEKKWRAVTDGLAPEPVEPVEPLDPAVAALLTVAIRGELKTALPHFDDDDLDFAMGLLDHNKVYAGGQLDVDRVARFARFFAPQTAPEPAEPPAPTGAQLLGSFLSGGHRNQSVATSRREDRAKPAHRRH